MRCIFYAILIKRIIYNKDKLLEEYGKTCRIAIGCINNKRTENLVKRQLEIDARQTEMR
ncbi:hypothetical protein [Thermoanaerobacterium thermosaccharolyticum]|uniref:hypothetical protein n=1 Tax=Thermoanaerobacterium thermosaccharolyticum TaxID=1517 RepID=UPI00177CB75B|nr:hypothetical protein [Thermoanaerobacterium thermosaccharolyticum]